MSRNKYLKRCMTISLRHRASWVVMGGLAGLALAALLNLGVLWLIALTVLGAGLSALAVAVNSYLRHANDIEAQPQDLYAAPRQGTDS